MTAEELISILQLLTGASLAIGVVLGLLAFLSFQRSRSDKSYWRKRRQAGQRGFRFATFALIILVLSAALCVITGTIMFVEDDTPATSDLAENDASATPEATRTLIIPTSAAGESTRATPTESPTNPPTASDATPDSDQPTEDATPQPTTPDVVVQAPTANPVQSGQLIITALDDVLSDTWQPIQPTTNFPTTTTRIFVFYSFNGWQTDMAWQQVLLRDGEVIRQNDATWGNTPNAGDSFFFFGDSLGFPIGNYEVRLLASDGQTVLASTTFTVTP